MQCYINTLSLFDLLQFKEVFFGESFHLMLVIIIIIAITTIAAIPIIIIIIIITITTIIVMTIVANVFIIIARLVGTATSSLLIGQFHLFGFQFIDGLGRKGKICIFHDNSI